METREIRLERLLALLAEEHGKRAKLAARLKKSPSQLSQWLGRYRTINEDSAREIEHNAGKPAGWLDHPAGPPDQPPTKQPPDLAAALPVVLGRLPGLGSYRAGQVIAALQAAAQPGADLEVIERDLLQWLSEPRAPEADGRKRQAPG